MKTRHARCCGMSAHDAGSTTAKKTAKVTVGKSKAPLRRDAKRQPPDRERPRGVLHLHVERVPAGLRVRRALDEAVRLEVHPRRRALEQRPRVRREPARCAQAYAV